MEGRGKLIMECILETKAILALVRGLQGRLSVTFVPFFATRLRRLLEWRKSQGAVRHRELS
jgi:hypothetical protein